MTHQIRPEQQDPSRDEAFQLAELSIMAVQEKLGLFNEHQTHADRIKSKEGQPITDLQHALQEKLLSYV